ncbi:hypothetical protein CYMTET_11750 [Cymbomonas tetramitiformis]|uniref:Uncharacterized protein n=1 Tax=Cymbomonas tetramitiformis TaxID=36881 RepID=A0AAE0GLQ5_9CHLO|nr:hypothetical protein CYMTET_11750 [Cymbomonas tetramitiformis]
MNINVLQARPLSMAYASKLPLFTAKSLASIRACSLPKVNISSHRGVRYRHQVFRPQALIEVDTPLEPGEHGCALSLVAEEVDIGSHQVRVVRPKDEDAVLDMYINSGHEEADPYWATLWPSSICLASLLLAETSLVAGKEVCDLGSGLGLAGVGAALAGAQQVTMCDREPLALKCIQRTAGLNGLNYLTKDMEGMQASRESFVSTAVLDWDDEEPDVGKFDVVLACDVLYQAAAVAPLAQIVPKLLARDGMLILADPPERTPENRRNFVKMVNGILDKSFSHRIVYNGQEHELCVMHFGFGNALEKC